jgi:Methylase of polypeptide chain release factors
MRTQLRNLLSAWKEVPFAHFTAADRRGRGYDRLVPQLAAAAGHVVASGPYRGMKYFSADGVPAIDTTPMTKFLGSFEEEIHPWIESLIDRRFERIVHLGAGVGFHAVGLARRCTWASSIVFDTLIAARHACRALALQNGVRDRVQLRGYCGPDGLLEVELAGSLVFSDCGGAELGLLDPRLYPALRLSTILVETHDAFDPRITKTLRSRFAGTHQIDVAEGRQRDVEYYPLLNNLSLEMARKAVDETRRVTDDGKTQTWLLLAPYAS